MSQNPNRLPLLIEIGLLASRAITQEHIDHLVLPAEDSQHTSADAHWEAVIDKLEDLAQMDHIDNFYPNNSPILAGSGILNSYWTLRHWKNLAETPDC
ncbi:hypothetical protein [Pseudomonas syringae]|uniref:hypothetical protein n=1 Tax=Pseudomonas syringae TaxID=317 RepID=UPI001F2ADC61|nr:hypothetical protein [Pseudomonas syringae]MBL3831712.1 hypothetical protein [Pseudomonas syringae pv. theae]MBL3838225.1 hypothetical protein [Pseudomonas syringae pv. theae]MBL3869907.1 hypothetical protein [Pseudomonas syringae pv. theae]GKQ48993.1 hypothetical protein PSTH2693_27575 [Pseudomonas syringae pv. theae]